MPVIGFLSGVSPGPFAQRLAAFRQGLNETDMIEGRNVVIESRWAEGQYDRLPALATDLVDRRVVVIVAYTDAPHSRPRRRRRPFQSSFLSAMIRSSPVSCKPRPAGREHHRRELVRGRFGAEAALAAARTRAKCGRYRSARGPQLCGRRFACERVQTAARTLRLQLVVLDARTASDIDMAFARLLRERAGALLVGAGAFLVSRRNQIISLAARHAVPAIYGFREYSADGGLISYGNDIPHAFRRAGVHTGRILKGDKPADLPVEQATKFELVINLKTAKALGLDVPLSVHQRSDEVIE